MDGRISGEEEEGRGTAGPCYPKDESCEVWSLFWEMEDSGPKGCLVAGTLFWSCGDRQSSGDSDPSCHLGYRKSKDANPAFPLCVFLFCSQ